MSAKENYKLLSILKPCNCKYSLPKKLTGYKRKALYVGIILNVADQFSWYTIVYNGSHMQKKKFVNFAICDAFTNAFLNFENGIFLSSGLTFHANLWST